MTLDEHIKKEQLGLLISSWKKLNWFQRKSLRLQVFLVALPRIAYRSLEHYIEYQRSRWYPAHWI